VAFEDLYWLQEAYYSDVCTGRRLQRRRKTETSRPLTTRRGTSAVASTWPLML